jgi:hypothetical protein
LKQSTLPGPHVAPQVVPSALQVPPGGQQANWHAMGVDAGQQRLAFNGLHVLPPGQHRPGAQVTEPCGQLGMQVKPSGPQVSLAAQHVCAHGTGRCDGQQPPACRLHVSVAAQQKLPQSRGVLQQHSPPPLNPRGAPDSSGLSWLETS